jgi:hypothetical protein
MYVPGLLPWHDAQRMSDTGAAYSCATNPTSHAAHASADATADSTATDV